MNNAGLNDNVYWMLLQVVFRAKHGLMRLSEQHDLTVMQLYTLCIMNPKKPIPMNTISCALSCDASNVTGIVDRLLSQGYIVREEKPEDRRVKMITLTAEGEKIRYQILGALSEYQLPEYQRLSSEQLQQLKAILSTLLESPTPIL
ncbi:MAG: MarR family transcriptional regulator [Candidatus Saccharibacteria bacterium]|nr:MarR family transcriptional regulator [Candidatus Saccharibacteria bacterium]